MRYALFALALYCLFRTEATAAECYDSNIVFAVDSSSSINTIEWRQQMDGYKAAFYDPDIVALIVNAPCGAIVATTVRWAGFGVHWQEIGWTVISDEASARQFGDHMAALPYNALTGTAIFEGIAFSYRLLQQIPPHYRSEKQIIDVSGDGRNNAPRHAMQANECDEMRRAGVVVNGLPIINNYPDNGLVYSTKDDGVMEKPIIKTHLIKYYEQVVICGVGAFVVPAYGFEDFPRAIKEKFAQEMIALSR